MKQTVEQFVDALKISDVGKYVMVMAIREKVQIHNSRVEERMMYGGIMFSLAEDLGGIFIYKNHISFEFGHGVEFDDPDGLLQGGGKYRRHLKIKSTRDVAFTKIDYYLKQMLDL